MPGNQNIELLQSQVVEAQERYPGLELAACPTKGLVVRGRVGFSTLWEKETVEDDYLIELRSFDAYPYLPPRAFEVEGKIGKDFGHFLADGSLCLGAPVEVRYRFAKSRDLATFIEKQVVPYLFSYSYFSKHGEVPYGQRSHGYLGILEYYMEFFGVPSVTALGLLKLLADDFAPPASMCPCGSKLKLKDCHGPHLDLLRLFSLPSMFLRELIGIIQEGEALGHQYPFRVLPKKLQRQRRKNR